MDDGDRDRTAGGTTRRRLLGAGAGLLAATAGCSSGGAGDATPGIADSPDAFGHRFPYLTDNAQLNPWVSSYPHSVHTALFEVPSVVVPGEGRRLTALLEGVELDGTTATVRYAEGFSWWNGEPVTARDRWVAERIQAHVDEAVAGERGGPDVALLDDRAVEYEFDRELARPLVLSRVAAGATNTPAWFFERWLEAFEEATTRAARRDVVADLRGRAIPLQEAADVGLGCGPYELAEVSPNRLVLELVADHPRADDIEIPRLWFPVADGLAAEGLLDEGWLDGERGLLDEVGASPPGHIEQLARYRTNGGVKLSFNWHNPHLARRGVRRAIACAVPLDGVAATGGWGDPAAVQTGLTAPPQDRWLDDALGAALHRYPQSIDVDRAAHHMRAAGYAREGDGWRGPDGERAAFRFTSPLFEGWESASQVVVDALEEFGFDVEFRQLANAAFLEKTERAQYDVVPYWTDGRPHWAYDLTSGDPRTLGYGLEGSAGGESKLAKPVRPTVPATPGSLSADGEGRRIDLRELSGRIRERTSAAETAAAVATVATWWNYDLPDLDVATTASGVWGNTRDFAWPPAGDWRYRAWGPADRPEFHLLRTGAVRPAGGA